MYFAFLKENHWPPLSWLATCQPDQTAISIRHGCEVETRDEWFCEAVWDDEFEQGDFDHTDIVFGSGARLRNETLTFVSSGSTCDRLHHIQIENICYVSNSLVCLAAVLGLEFDPWYPGYYEDISSIGHGIDGYKTSISSNQGELYLTYYRNLCWDEKQIIIIEKPVTERNFENFDEYQSLLIGKLKGLQRNMSASTRQLSFTPMSTCSSGYDSLAVSVLAREIGAQEAICVPQDRIDLNDSGVEMIEQLDMQALVIERNTWRQTDFAEALFIAADACGRDVWLQPAAEHLFGHVLLTGYFGDAAWGEKPVPPESRLYRSQNTGPAGVSLGEFRLQAGFIHCPVPYIAAETIQSSHLHAQNSEMQAWRKNRQYDRPIPRRIIEASGIEREQFGNRKTATTVHLFREKEFERFFAGTESFRDYMRWVRRLSRQHAPPPSEFYKITSPKRETIEIPLVRQLFPWAVDRCKALYRDEVTDSE